MDPNDVLCKMDSARISWRNQIQLSRKQSWILSYRGSKHSDFVSLLSTPFVSTLPRVRLHRAEDAHCVHSWSVHIWCLPEAGTSEADTLSLFPGSKFTRPSLRMFVRTMETLFPSLVFANRCLPLWHRTTNLWSNEGGTHTETPVTWEGNTPIRLFPWYSAVTECDNYPFSFPIQPPGDGRFSILSPTLNLRNFSLWLLTSTGGWKKAKLL